MDEDFDPKAATLISNGPDEEFDPRKAVEVSSTFGVADDEHMMARGASEARLSLNPKSKKAKEVLERQKSLGLLPDDDDPVDLPGFTMEASIYPEEQYPDFAVDIREGTDSATIDPAPEFQMNGLEATAKPQDFNIGITNEGQRVDLSQPISVQDDDAPELDEYLEKTTPSLIESAKRRAESLLAGHRAGQFPLSDNHVEALVRTVYQGTTPVDTLKGFAKGMWGLVDAETPGKVAGMIGSAAKTGAKAAEAALNPTAGPETHGAVTGTYTAVTEMGQLAQDALLSADSVANYIAPGIDIKTGKKIDPVENRIRNLIQIQKNHHSAAWSQRKLREHLNVDPEDPLNVTGETLGDAAIPVGGAIKTGKYVAQIADAGVDMAAKGGAKIASSKIGSRAYRPAIHLARGRPLRAAVSAIIGETRNSGGWLGRMQELALGPVDPKFNDVTRAIAEAPDGMSGAKYLQSQISEELNRLKASEAAIRAEHAGKSFRIDQTTDGKPTFSPDQLKGPDKEIFDVRQKISLLESRHSKLDATHKLHRIASDFTKAGIRYGVGAGETAAVMGAMGAQMSLPSQVEESTEEMATMGLAFGIPAGYQIAKQGKLEMHEDKLAKSGLADFKERGIEISSPRGRRLAVTQGLVKNFGIKIEPKTKEEILHLQGSSTEGAAAVNGWFDGKDTVVVNTDALDSGVEYHEITHAIEKAIGEKVINHKDLPPEMVAEFKRLYEKALSRSGLANQPETDIDSELAAELGRDILQSVGPEEFFGGKSGSRIIQDAMASAYDRLVGKSVAGIAGQVKTQGPFGAISNKSQRRELTDILYGVGEAARTGHRRADLSPVESPDASKSSPRVNTAGDPSKRATGLDKNDPVYKDAMAAMKALKVVDGGAKVQSVMQEMRYAGETLTAEEVVRRATQKTVPKSFMPKPDEPRAIREAAIRYPDGKIYTGNMHSSAIDKAMAEGRSDTGYDDYGFVTNEGEFLDTEQSLERAREVKQIDKGDYEDMNMSHGGLESDRFADSRRFMPSSHQQAIQGAAIQVDDMIFRGKTWSEAKRAAEDYGINPAKLKNSVEGYVTKQGQFKDKTDARAHAESIGQMPEEMKDNLTPQEFSAGRRFMPVSRDSAQKIAKDRGLISRGDIDGVQYFEDPVSGKELATSRFITPEEFDARLEALRNPSPKFMPSARPDAIDKVAMKRKSDGKVFVGNEVQAHWMIPSEYPELRDRFTYGGVDRYVDGWVDKNGKFLDKKQAHARAVKIKQLDPQTKTEYKGALSSLDFEQTRFMPATVNIGLDVPDGGKITPDQAIAALKKVGVDITEQSVHQSNSEPTLVASLSRPLTPAEADQVSADLKQEAIAQFTGESGELYGPKAESWRPFNPEYFLTHGGESLGKSFMPETPKEGLSKLDPEDDIRDNAIPINNDAEKRYFELDQKELEGTLTKAERGEMDELLQKLISDYGSYGEFYRSSMDQQGPQFMPSEEITREADRLGLAYTGDMGEGNLHLFNDPITKSTIALKSSAKRGELQEKLRSTRDKFLNPDGLSFMPSKNPDAIAEAAIRYPDGKVFTGVMHMDALDKATEHYGGSMGIGWGDYASNYTSGFVDGNGNYLTREEALARAKEIGQLTDKGYKKAEDYFSTGEVKPNRTQLESLSFARARRFMPSDHPDAIVEPSIKMPDGRIYGAGRSGFHDNAVEAAEESGVYFAKDFQNAVEGFTTKTGKFLTREEAVEHAKSIGQIEQGEYKQSLDNVFQKDAGEADWLETNAFDKARKFMPHTISQRVPTAKAATEDALSTPLKTDLESVMAHPRHADKLASVIKKYTGPRVRAKKTREAMEEFVNHVTENLVWLHDQMPPEVRERAKKWYDGANKIAGDLAEQFKHPKEAIAGVMAALSPQNPWHNNVSLAERVLDIHKNRGDYKFDEPMAKTMDQIFPRAKYPDIHDELHGKSFNDLNNNYLRAAWLRIFDETHNPREYRVVTPEGGREDVMMTGDRPTPSNWFSIGPIEKALNVLDNPSRENISLQMGFAHKVRNFYNNIIDPENENGDYTSDTHNVAAALVKPLGGSAKEVMDNFGSAGKSALTGNKGTYALYAEAGRRAAAARGIRPREMQSITWEAVRGLFSPEFKLHNEKGIDAVNKIWEDYENEIIDINEARDAILEITGGIARPEWFTEAGPEGISPEQEPPFNPRELSGLPVPGWGAESLASGGGGNDPTPRTLEDIQVVDTPRMTGLQELDPF